MSQTARAVVFYGADEPLELRTVSLPRLNAGELLVKVTCSTLCGSDLHTYHGDRSTPCPTILGHEILGTVAELPAGEPAVDYAGTPLCVGDRVTWGIAASCGDCFFCNRDLPQKCESLFKYGHQQWTDTHPLSGGLADYCHLAAGTPVFRIPDSLPDEVACPVNCATATVAAALRAAGDMAGECLLIHGAGMLGLTAAAMARSGGCREVIVADVDSGRLERAVEFGATRTVLSAESDEKWSQVIREATAGRGVDVAIDVSGAPPAMLQGVETLRIGGRAVWVGAVFPTPPLSLVPERVVRNMLTIRGVHNYAPQDLAAAIGFLDRTHGKYPFARLISEEFPLSEAAAAFTAAGEPGTFRVMLRP